MANTVKVENDPGCLIQVLWFIFIGWWAGLLWLAAAWILMITVIGIPFGVMMINALPKVIALKGPAEALMSGPDGKIAIIRPPQINIILRIIYFILFGWWFSLIWVVIGYLICLTIIGLPIGLWMLNQTPAILSLHR